MGASCSGYNQQTLMELILWAGPTEKRHHPSLAGEGVPVRVAIEEGTRTCSRTQALWLGFTLESLQVTCTSLLLSTPQVVLRRRADRLWLVGCAWTEVQVDLKTKQSPGRLCPQIRAALGSHLTSEGHKKMSVE